MKYNYGSSGSGSTTLLGFFFKNGCYLRWTMRRVRTTSRGLLARQAARPATRLQLRCAAGPSANKRRLHYWLNIDVQNYNDWEPEQWSRFK